MKKYASMTAFYALSHFIIDFSCAYFLFSLISGTKQWLLCLLTYNFCAFALQMPIGIIADKINKNRFFAAFGCLLILISPIFDSAPVILCITAGLGNALFHIGAGRDVLCQSEQRFSALGVFVSPGAAGLYFGMYLGKRAAIPISLVLASLLLFAVLIIFIIPLLYDNLRFRSESFNLSLNNGKSILLITLCLFLVVCTRSYTSMSLSFPWKGEGHLALILTSAVVLGKASGGFLADRFGAFRISYISLSLCVLLSLFYNTPVCGIISVLLFNMTMPITLGAISKLFPSALGFGFGLLTFGLFLGFIPIIAGFSFISILPFGFASACVASIVLLYFGLKEPEYAA